MIMPVKIFVLEIISNILYFAFKNEITQFLPPDNSDNEFFHTLLNATPSSSPAETSSPSGGYILAAAPGRRSENIYPNV